MLGQIKEVKALDELIKKYLEENEGQETFEEFKEELETNKKYGFIKFLADELESKDNVQEAMGAIFSVL